MKYYAQVRIVNGEVATGPTDLSFLIIPKYTYDEYLLMYGDSPAESRTFGGAWYFVECEYEEEK